MIPLLLSALLLITPGSCAFITSTGEDTAPKLPTSTAKMTTESDTVVGFDSTDPQYKVTDEFLPDKESTWPYPKEQDGWIWIHNAIRYDLDLFQNDLFPALLSRENPLTDWEISYLQEIYDLHMECVHVHHTTEDEIIAPNFSKRFRYPQHLVEDHDDLVQKLHSLHVKFHNLKPGEDRATALTSLQQHFVSYSHDLRQHLREEEELCLPLQRAYFTPKEYMKVMNSGSASHKPSKLGSGWFVYAVGGKEKIKNEFMKTLGIPFFVWYLAFKYPLKEYEKVILSKSNAIIDGKMLEPVSKNRFWNLFRLFRN